MAQNSGRLTPAPALERCANHRDSIAITATDDKRASASGRPQSSHALTTSVSPAGPPARSAALCESTSGGSIPVLPLEQQQAYGDAFRRLAEFRTTLDHAAEIGAALAREISDALTTGTLDLSP